MEQNIYFQIHFFKHFSIPHSRIFLAVDRDKAAAYCERRRNIGPAVYKETKEHSKRRKRLGKRRHSGKHQNTGSDNLLMSIESQNDENEDDHNRAHSSANADPLNIEPNEQSTSQSNVTQQASPGLESETQGNSGNIQTFGILLMKICLTRKLV